MAHETTIDVRFSELDPYGHVNHAVYVTYLEIGRTTALADCGVPINKMADDGFQMVVTGIEVLFKRSAGPGETLVVESTIGEVKRASAVWHQRIVRDGEELISAKVKAGITNSQGRPCRPPEWLFPSLQPLFSS